MNTYFKKNILTFAIVAATLISFAASADPISKKIKALDAIRIQEMPYEVLKAKIEKYLVELGYSVSESQKITEELLDFKNNKLSSAKIIARHKSNEYASVPRSIQTERFRISNTQAPIKLYHWTTLESAKKLFSEAGGANFPLKTLNNSGLTTLNAMFRNRPGLFLWSNPVTGLALNSREVHGGEVLIEIEIDPVLTSAVTFESLAQAPDNRVMKSDDIKTALQKYGLDKVDLMRHTFGPSESPLFQEWVLLSTQPIKAISIDPSTLAPLVRAELAKLRDGNYHYDASELFSFVKIFEPEHADHEKLYYESMEFRTSVADFIQKKYLDQIEAIENTFAVKSVNSFKIRCRNILLSLK